MSVVRARLSLLSTAVLAFFTVGAHAATITLESAYYSENHPVPHLRFDGPVLEGDLAQLQALFDANITCGFDQFPLEGSNCAIITLASPGGNYIEGLRLAQFLRENRIATKVEAGTECYSACAFAFLGGSGYSSQDGIGVYIDRMVTPGALLGFHAPYFASDSLDGLVAEYGLDEVLGATRDDISLMIRELVNWNVDENVLSYIVSMGPDETYDVRTGEDYFLTRTALPPELSFTPAMTIADIVLSACVNLLAEHESKFPSTQLSRITESTMTEIGVDSSGARILGYRLGPDNPLDLTFCGMPAHQLKGNGDVDFSLYTGAGIEGDIRPMLTLFNRPFGWSSMGGTGNITRSIFQKGAITALFINTLVPIGSDQVR